MIKKCKIHVATQTMQPGKMVEREFFIDKLLVRIHFITVMIRWTGLTPCEFEFRFPGSLPSTVLGKMVLTNQYRLVDECGS